MLGRVKRITVAAVAICCSTCFSDNLISSERGRSENFQALLAPAESDFTCVEPITFGEGVGPTSRGPLGGDIPPVRYVIDPYPTFNGIAIDPDNNRVLMTDENRKSLLIYDRASGSASRSVTQPVQQVIGPATGLGFVAGVALDPVSREVYVADNDIEDTVVVFSYDVRGNAKPKRYLFVPHQTWGVSLNRSSDELAISVQQLNMIAIYRREAQRLEAPVRIIRGPQSGMADPHGIYWDTVHNEIAVANHGNYSIITPYGAYDAANPHPELSSGGHFQPPSITVYPGAAKGDTIPLRTIQGSKTRLNWPMGISVDALHNEIAVANNGDSSVLVFSRTGRGDSPPVRILRGSKTGIDGPVGVAIDTKNEELWVANYSDHTAVVFPRTANGNVAPKRILRNAPAGTPTGGFTNPYALAFDSKRDEILVPN